MFRRLLAVFLWAALALPAAAAPPAMVATVLSARADPCPGAIVCGSFPTSAFKGFGVITSQFAALPGLTVTRASGGYAENPDGSLVWFQPGQARATAKGLGVFEATTNLQPGSNALTGANWAAFNATVATGSVLGPDAQSTLFQITSTSSSGNRVQTSGAGAVVTASTVYTFTEYLAAGTARFSGLVAGNGAAAGAIYNLQSCTVVSTAGSGVTASMTLGPVMGGVQLCRAVLTFTTTGTAVQVGAGVSDGSTYVSTIYPSAASGTIYAGFADLRLGSYPVPYCPTTTVAATCAADRVLFSGSMPTTGTLYANVLSSPLTGGIYALVAEMANAGSANVVDLYKNAGTTPYTWAANVSGATNFTFTARADTAARMAYSFTAGSVNAAVNGVYGTRVAAGTPGATDQLVLGDSRAGNQQINGYIAGFALYPQAFSDAQLRDLTSGVDTSSLSLNFASGTYRTTTPYVRTNLILWSQDYTNADWTKSAGGVTTTANATAAPDSSLTGSKIAYGAGTTAEYVYKSAKVSFTSGVSYTQSYYVKIGSGIQYVQIPFNPSNFSGNIYANFDVSSCTWTAAASGVTARAAPAGNGWCRVSATAAATATGTGDAAYSCWAVPSGSSTFAATFTYAGTEFCYAWGGQVEATPSATSYIGPTTTAAASVATTQSTNPADVGALTVARTTTGAVGSYAQDTAGNLKLFADNVLRITDQGVLVEESRQNLYLWSQVLTSWAAPVFSTATTAATTAPDGTLTGNLLKPDTSSNLHRINSAGVTISNATVYTFSVYAKAAGYRYLYVNGAASPNQGQATIDLQSCAITATATGSAVASTAVNGWCRIAVTGTSALTSNQVFLQVNDTSGAGDRTFAGDGTSGVYIWGAQLEAGAFATSYIPTTSAAVTRSADVVSYAYSQSGAGPLTFAAGGQTAVAAGVRQTLANLDDGTTSNAYTLAINAPATQALAQITSVGSSIFSPVFSTPTTGVFNFALRWQSGPSYAASVGGQAVQTGSTGTLPATTILRLGDTAGGNRQLNGYLSNVRIYPYAANDNELAYRSAGNF